MALRGLKLFQCADMYLPTGFAMSVGHDALARMQAGVPRQNLKRAKTSHDLESVVLFSKSSALCIGSNRNELESLPPHAMQKIFEHLTTDWIGAVIVKDVARLASMVTEDAYSRAQWRSTARPRKSVTALYQSFRALRRTAEIPF